jgi:hypothetical protein
MFFVPSVKSSNVSLFLISMILKLLINSFNRGAFILFTYYLHTCVYNGTHTSNWRRLLCPHISPTRLNEFNYIIFFLKIITDINMSMSCLVYWFVLHCCILFTHVILEIVNCKFQIQCILHTHSEYFFFYTNIY